MKLHVSVRNLVEFIFRSGDIDNRRTSAAQADAMLEGSRIHRKIQKSMGDSYQAEVPLLYVEHTDAYDLEIEGRADGIFREKAGNLLHHRGIAYTCAFDEVTEIAAEDNQSENEERRNGDRQSRNRRNSDEEKKDDSRIQTCECWIDEIKGIYRNLDALEEPLYVHKAQAMCYAYIYALQNNQDRMGIQMTYCNLDTEEVRRFREEYSFSKLKVWFVDLMRQYRKWADYEFEWEQTRTESIHGLEFPFAYRPGQQKLVADVYRTILRKKILFLQAPTGVGKTISTVFPAVKAVGEGLADRIFYLTAKTVTAAVAVNTFALLNEHGYQGKTIQITAKEKLCPCEEMECNPVHCPYAKGHYDRVNDAVFDLLKQPVLLITREVLLAQAKRFEVCPFEMCLDTASFADHIICDYNYAFDPNVQLKRFFAENTKEDYIFLVDEAHNLVERAREMYSATLVKEDVLAAKRLIKSHSTRIAGQMEKCNKILLEWKREYAGSRVMEDAAALYFPLSRLMAELDEFLQKPVDFPERKEILDFYFEVRDFLRVYEQADDHYVIYSGYTEEGHFFVKLFCVDPSENLQQNLDKTRATIFFSATLLPIGYYKNILSTCTDNYAIYAETSFRPEQKLLLVARDVSSLYTRRNETEFRRMAAYIDRTVRAHQGNYMVFFPSYKMLGQVYDAFVTMQEEYEEAEALSDKQKMNSRIVAVSDELRMGDEINSTKKREIIYTIKQTNHMTEAEREAFLAEFEMERDGSLVAFCVMGGIFGEGIDLTAERLIGAIVVGTGLPQIGDEREILKNYYKKHSENGFDYAYRFPGLNKVLQAAGRVIRTDQDRGVILLLDERFLGRDYAALFPREWEQRSVCTLETVERQLADFWEGEGPAEV